jgi:hypothetical protein
MIEDATHQRTDGALRAERLDPTNMRLLGSYLERSDRPAASYTGKASLFQAAPKGKIKTHGPFARRT